MVWMCVFVQGWEWWSQTISNFPYLGIGIEGTSFTGTDFSLEISITHSNLSL